MCASRWGVRQQQGQLTDKMGPSLMLRKPQCSEHCIDTTDTLQVRSERRTHRADTGDVEPLSNAIHESRAANALRDAGQVWIRARLDAGGAGLPWTSGSIAADALASADGDCVARVCRSGGDHLHICVGIGTLPELVVGSKPAQGKEGQGNSGEGTVVTGEAGRSVEARRALWRPGCIGANHCFTLSHSG
jgi:hypothetical protein